MKIFSRFLLGVALVAASLGAGAVSLSLVPSLNDSVQTGASFTLDLVITGLGDHVAPSLKGFDVDVEFDDTKLTFTGVTFGPSLGSVDLGDALAGFDDANAGVINVFEQSFLEASSSSCSFCVSPYLEDLQGSSQVLATLSFQASHHGNAVFGLSINLLTDGNNDVLAATTPSQPAAEVRVIPEPGTVWLFALLLPALAFGLRSPPAMVVKSANLA